jgi:periplasmic mercuric ion binding protein
MKSLALLLASIAVAGAAHAAGAHSATLAVTNMDCATCPITVRKALERVPGVESAKVDFKTKLATVAFDPAKTKPEALVKATTEAGYPSTVKQVQ